MLVSCSGGSKGETAGGEPCGPKTCPAGEVCCNPSCGICTPPGGFCTQNLCGDTSAVAREPEGCNADSDCRTFSDYCTGCDCRALASGQEPPACPGPGVRCLVDPCQDRVALCQEGKCVTSD